jgi:hypothetical protein
MWIVRLKTRVIMRFVWQSGWSMRRYFVCWSICETWEFGIVIAFGDSKLV